MGPAGAPPRQTVLATMSMVKATMDSAQAPVLILMLLLSLHSDLELLPAILEQSVLELMKDQNNFIELSNEETEIMIK